MLTGEPRSYDASAAAFKRPNSRPSGQLQRRQGRRLGAWELSTRYSYIDLNDENIEGGKQKIAGLGLSWYPTNMLRFVLQGDYVDVDLEDDSDVFYSRAALAARLLTGPGLARQVT